MAEIDEAVIAQRIRDVVGRSRFGERLDDVTLEVERDVDAGNFLRVVIRLHELQSVRSVDLAPLVEAIEESVAEVDDRFPSVRFAEAA